LGWKKIPDWGGKLPLKVNSQFWMGRLKGLVIGLGEKGDKPYLAIIGLGGYCASQQKRIRI